MKPVKCPLCRRGSFIPVFHLGAAPLVPFVSHVKSGYAAELDIVSCRGCGHVFNRAYEESSQIEMYEVGFLTNKPVSLEMSMQLDGILERIGDQHIRGKRVLEIGAGTGDFARMMAARARQVVVVEPSLGLTKEMLPEHNIALITDFFGSHLNFAIEFDLIVCRQVLEHVVDPVKMLQDMVKILAPGGLIYVEVPRSEWIWERLALVELHQAHVQYFSDGSLRYAAALSDLAVADSWTLKAGHDVGFMLGRSGGDMVPGLHKTKPDATLCSRLAEKRRAMEVKLRSIGGRGALYGANWQGASFFWLFDGFLPGLETCFDDNIDITRYHLFSGAKSIPIAKTNLEGVDWIIVTAHLHASGIAEKCRQLGFEGPVIEAVDLGRM